MANAREYLENANAAGQQLNGYNPSADVQAANQTLADVNAGRPVNYTSADADRMGQLYDSIINRGDFSYDPNKDSVYTDARNSYIEGGKAAMNDTMRQTAGMNGGYGAAWSASAADQQFDEYMRGINDIMPALENNAYNAYNAEGDRLNAAYQMAQQRDDTAYGRYRDQMADWQADRSFAQAQADNMYARDYNEYSNRMNMANTAAGWNAEDMQHLKSDAYGWAVTLLKQGIMPTADVLANAGISNTDAKRLAEKFGYGRGSGGGGGRKKGGSGGTAKADTLAWFKPAGIKKTGHTMTDAIGALDK